MTFHLWRGNVRLGRIAEFGESRPMTRTSGVGRLDADELPSDLAGVWQWRQRDGTRERITQLHNPGADFDQIPHGAAGSAIQRTPPTLIEGQPSTTDESLVLSLRDDSGADLKADSISLHLVRWPEEFAAHTGLPRDQWMVGWGSLAP